MKKFKSFWALLALPFMVASCSNDEPAPDKGGENTSSVDGVYMSVSIQPYNVNGSRSQTTGGNQSNDGNEVGTDEENAVKTALIVLTDRSNKLIGSSLTPSADGKGKIEASTVSGNPQYGTVAKFDKTELADYYNAYSSSSNPFTGAVGDVRVFVFCNPTSELLVLMENAETGKADWTDYIANVKDDALWSKENGFIMSNVSIADRQLPATLAAWDNFNVETNPFKLSGSNGSAGATGTIDNSSNNNRGAVKVHRMAARFDFRDGSQMDVEGGNGLKGTDFTYTVVKNADNQYIVNCEIIGMALTNMSTSQYYLGRVSDNGLPTGSNFALCGSEEINNYVVSTNAAEKFAEIKSNFSNYFYYPFFNPEGLVYSKGEGWDWHQVSEVVKGQSDNYGDKNYHIWRYVAENTIPGPPTKQINAQSTGVVFKARMNPTSVLNDEGSDKWEKLLYKALAYANNGAGDADLHQNADLDPIIYSLVGKLAGNSLFVTWQNVQEAAMAAAGFDDTKKPEEQNLDRNSPLYHLICGNGGMGDYKYMYHERVFTDDTQTEIEDKYTEMTFQDNAQDPTAVNTLWEKWETERQANPESASAIAARTAFKKAATEKGFTLYQSSQDPESGKWGYYCYYYYWNRHNDNGLDGTMGAMEFAVVRNNVYKLAVVALNTLGHPRIPENDPDDPKPDTPDEKSEVYISVDVQVLPWVVRLNNIVFN